MTRLALHHVFSDDPTDAPLNMGVMNRDKIAEFLGHVLPAPSIDQVYVCGPFQMNDEAEAALLAAGVPEARIHIERFGVAAPAGAPVGAVLHEAQPGDAEQARIVIIRDGMRREIEFRKDQPSILDAASAAGLEVPFSCTSRRVRHLPRQAARRRGAHGAQLRARQGRGGRRLRAHLPGAPADRARGACPSTIARWQGDAPAATTTSARRSSRARPSCSPATGTTPRR